MPSKCRLFKNQDMTDANIIWAMPGAGAEPVPDGMGRSHRGHSRGQAVQRNRARHRGEPARRARPDGGPHGPGDHARRAAEARPRVRPDVDKLTLDAPAPLAADADGKYPIPTPGKFKDREYA